MNGRNGTTIFLPLESRIGGQGRCIHPSVGQFLTREQSRFHVQKDRDRGNNKYRYNRTGNRTGKIAR